MESIGSTTIFDAFAGAWVDEPISQLDRFKDGRVDFSSDMSLALYEAKSGDQAVGIALRELSTGKVLWSVPNFYSNVGTAINWSPDSSWIAVVDPEFLWKQAKYSSWLRMRLRLGGWISSPRCGHKVLPK